ncbi:MAG: glycosyltransferase [Fibrobacteraceae bacterium]|nr:glycosyltransferase [Fibrobacteraceae bacterium]
MEKRHLYFYSDAQEWGGQEILAARIANILSKSGLYKVHFFFASFTFTEKLSHDVEKIHLPYHSQGPLPIIRDGLSSKAKIAKKIFKANNAGSPEFNQLIICPGNIERCTPAVRAAKSLGLSVISYYPMAYTQKESKAKFGVFRDFLALQIYPQISKWIVNTPYQEKLLRRFINKDTTVYQLPNPLTFKENSPSRPPQKIDNIATIGRLYFGQKGQEIIPELIKELSLKSVQFKVIGQGPDTEKFKDLVKQHNVQDHVEIIPWMSADQVHNLLRNNIDLLFIPSKFESGPIVLFEALQCGIPILAANENYIKDYQLPNWMLYEPGNVKEAADKAKAIVANWNTKEYESARNNLFKGKSAQEFSQRVLEIFRDL